MGHLCDGDTHFPTVDLFQLLWICFGDSGDITVLFAGDL